MGLQLWQKLLAIALLILTSAIGVLTYFSYQTTREAMFEEFHIRGRELAKAIASESRTYYRTQDVEGFTSLIQSLGEAEGVLAVLGYDASESIWIESSIVELTEAEIGLPSTAPVFQQDTTLQGGAVVSQFINMVARNSPDRHPDILGPHDHELFIGWIRILLDRHPLEVRLNQLLQQTLLFNGFTTVLGGIILVFLLRRSLRVIRPLTTATQQVASGRLDVSVPVLSNDELGQLATGFNQMTERLYQTTVSKDYLDSILKSMIDPLIVLNPNRTIQTVNQATLTLLGYRESDLLGQKGDILFPHNHNPLSRKGFDELLRKGTIDHIETSYKTKDGHQIPMMFSAALMHDGKGRMEGIACVAQDISKRKQAEDELRLSHGLLESIHRAKADFIASSDPHTTFQELLTSLLPLTKSTFGLLTETGIDKTGKSWLKTHAKCAKIGSAPITASHVTSSTPYNEEFLLLRPVIDQVIATRQTMCVSLPRPNSPTKELSEESAIRLTAVLSLPIFSHDQLVGILTFANGDKEYDEKTIQDLQPILSTCGQLIEAFRNEQRRLQAETALHESVERFDMAVRGSRDGLWDAWAVSDNWFDPQNPVYFSPRFKELLGFQDYEFNNVLESWISRLHPEDRDRAFYDLEAHLRQSIPYDSEYRMITKTGEYRWYAGRGEAIRDASGRPVRISGSFTDITERKKAQAELEKANARLKKLDQLRSQFFADISHELRTPLTVIRGEAEVTLRGKDKPILEYKTSLERIVQLTGEVNQLVSDLLFLARSETGTIQITKNELSLEKLLQDVLREATVLARKKHITITLENPPDSINLVGDPQRLKQLLLILLDNAIKYSDAYRSIQMGACRNAGDTTIEIIDHGQGIAEEDLPHIFDRFYRGHRIKDPAQPGAGLGLAIAKWITEAHGGHIHFSSRPGEGSTVTLRFPQPTFANEAPHETTAHRG